MRHGVLTIAIMASAGSLPATAQSTDPIKQDRIDNLRQIIPSRTFGETQRQGDRRFYGGVGVPDGRPELVALGRCILNGAPAEATSFAFRRDTREQRSRLQPVFKACGYSGLPGLRSDRVYYRRLAVSLAMTTPS